MLKLVLNCDSVKHPDNKDLVMAQIKPDLVWFTADVAATYMQSNDSLFNDS